MHDFYSMSAEQMYFTFIESRVIVIFAFSFDATIDAFIFHTFFFRVRFAVKKKELPAEYRENRSEKKNRQQNEAKSFDVEFVH